MNPGRRTPVIADWDEAKAAVFGDRTVVFRHQLHEREMFADEALAETLDRYPRERLGVFTMGADPADWTSWRRGEAGALPGPALLAAVRAGRLWLNLRNADTFLPEYAELCEEIATDKEAHVPGLRTFRRDLGLLISSPAAMVFYHLDVPLSSLWQVRGEKRIWFYPRSAPYVRAEQIERFVRREAEGQLPYDPAWDGAAQTVGVGPGDMVTWAQNAPHRVTNGAMVNVSLSMEFMTPAAALRANILWANGLLRRMGVRPEVQDHLGPVALAKLALARAAKAAARRKPYKPILPATFILDPRKPGALLPL
ncbi:MAG: hypothetical protein ACYC8V_02835 [Caulobacteraceae bacterium]